VIIRPSLRLKSTFRIQSVASDLRIPISSFDSSCNSRFLWPLQSVILDPYAHSPIAKISDHLYTSMYKCPSIALSSPSLAVLSSHHHHFCLCLPLSNRLTVSVIHPLSNHLMSNVYSTLTSVFSLHHLPMRHYPALPLHHEPIPEPLPVPDSIAFPCTIRYLLTSLCSHWSTATKGSRARVGF